MAYKIRTDRPVPEGMVAGIGSLRPKSSLKPAEPPYKRALFEQQEGRCHGCRAAFQFEELHPVHIIPKAAGGTDDGDNLLLLCRPCGRGKGGLSREYMIARLRQLGIEL